MFFVKGGQNHNSASRMHWTTDVAGPEVCPFGNMNIDAIGILAMPTVQQAPSMWMLWS
jgi:hypothetical protein